MEKRILVLGGTGMLGAPVARNLKQQGFQVRIMTRNKEKAQKLFDDSFEIVTGDVTDANDTEKALNGCYGVHINLQPSIELSVAENILNVASRLGLQRITYLSGATTFIKNPKIPLAKQKLKVEKLIKESGIPYTFFCPTGAMENILSMIRGNRANVIGKKPVYVHWFAAEDLGRMVAKSYTTEKAANKKLCIHGPEKLSSREALQRYCSEIHPEIKNLGSIPFWLAKIIGVMAKNESLKNDVPVMVHFAKKGEPGDPTEANNILGAPAITLDEWIKQRKAKLSTATA
ncbi:MAG: NmrA family NAD(P)-binding protein [Calditrichaeota bacterium]|nr:NmrA family NAD(P)-binding protein [Calditrichota bacterium]